MAMVHMKRTKAEKKAESKRFDGVGGESYPYGLRVRLGHNELEKLGMEGLPKVGSKVHLKSHAHVVSASEDHLDGEEPRRNVELELRHMDIDNSKEGHVENPAADGAKSAMDDALDDLKHHEKKVGRKPAKKAAKEK